MRIGKRKKGKKIGGLEKRRESMITWALHNPKNRQKNQVKKKVGASYEEKRRKERTCGKINIFV